MDDNAGEHGWPYRVKAELELGDHAEVAAAAFEAPEKVGVLGGAGGQYSAISGYQLGGEQALAGSRCSTRARSPSARQIHVYAVAGRLRAAEAGEDPSRAPRVRVRTSDGRWASVEAARLDGTADIAVSVHAASSDDILAHVSRAHDLTARERHLIALLLEGLDTRELAKRMFISAYTVNKSIFAKLGIHSRRELVAGVFGHPM